MPQYLGDVRCWVNSGKHLLSLSFSGFDPQLGHWCQPDIGPQFCYITNSISPSFGVHIEQRARRAAAGSYSGVGNEPSLALPSDLSAGPAKALPLPDKPSIAVLPFQNMWGERIAGLKRFVWRGEQTNANND